MRLRDGKGVRHLAELLANPGVEIHAVDLVTGVLAAAVQVAVDDGLAVRADSGDAGAVLDEMAKRAYRERITDLREDLEEAERFNDTERVARLREELDEIAGQLAGAVGLGGRDRRASSSAERARVNVTRAIRSTLRRVSEHEPALGGSSNRRFALAPTAATSRRRCARSSGRWIVAGADPDFDAVVIGSGFGGAVTACKLAEAG